MSQRSGKQDINNQSMSLKEKGQDDIEKRQDDIEKGQDDREKGKDEVKSLRGAEATWQSDEYTGTLF